jgi:hypothetical protein
MNIDNTKGKKSMVPEGIEPSALALLAPRANQLRHGTQLVVWVVAAMQYENLESKIRGVLRLWSEL